LATALQSAEPPAAPDIDGAKLFELSEWIAAAALAGASETALIQGLCEQLVAAGIRLGRVLVGCDTLHPVLEGHVFVWNSRAASVQQTEYRAATNPDEEDRWKRSPFFHLFDRGITQLRRRIPADHVPGEFPVVDDLRAGGATDYLALVNRFGGDAAIGGLDAVFSSWSTEAPGGFSDAAVAAIDRLAACLSVAIRGVALTRIADTLVETYLGRDAGRRVLKGNMARGVAERIQAVLWFSDLQNYTRISDTTPPDQLIPLLNDYSEALVSAIHAHDGQVLKFIGDGLLAIFAISDPADACGRALAAYDQAARQVAALNGRRVERGLPTTEIQVALHIGEVFYGNIGSVDRLDFTVVGPAVNEASRIEAMCRSLDRGIIVSAGFHESAGSCRFRLVSLGRYALRGVGRPQELFTLDPTAIP